MSVRFRAATGVIAAIPCLLVMAGCRVVGPPPPLSYRPDEAPVFLMLYHPYGVSQSHELAEPSPIYRGWTDERMNRDLMRLREAGVDVVLVGVDLERTSVLEFRYERLKRFIELAAGMPGQGPRVAFFLRLAPGGAAKANSLVAAFLGWLAETGVHRSAGYYQLEGRALIVLGPNIRMVSGLHPAFVVRRTAGYGARWHWPEAGASERASVSVTEKQAVVYGGWRGQAARADMGGRVRAEWRVPRERGRTLLAGLWAAEAARARFICVSSWNDYVNGDFVEPNSLDGRAAFSLLRNEISRVRRHVAGAASGLGQ